MNKRLVLFLTATGLVVGALALALLLALPAPDAAQAQAPETAAPAQPVMIMAVEQVVNGERFAGEVTVSFTDDPALPAAAPDRSGLFLNRSGDVLTVGTGAIEVEVGVEVFNDNDPVTTIQASHGGDELAIRVTPSTLIYADTTGRPEITPADITAGHKVIQRSLAPGSLDDIGEHMVLRAWGTLQNGELVADILVYEPIR